jgi:hypothetical protein
MGREQKEALFSARPLLVEGPSDSMICNAIVSRLGIQVDSAGSQIIVAGGKEDMRNVAKLLILLGKTPLFLVDLDGYIDAPPNLIDVLSNENPLKANILASKSGFGSIIKMDRDLRNDFTQAVRNDWDILEPLVSGHRYWKSKDNSAINDVEDKVKYRVTLAKLLCTKDFTNPAWPNATTWQLLQNRCLNLFSVLQELGLFILKKGTIEDYYNFADTVNTSDKTKLALEESDAIYNPDVPIDAAVYDDIIQALKQAALVEELNEAAALRNMVVSVISGPLMSLTEKISDTELQNIAKANCGQRAELFKLSNISTSADDLVLKVELKSVILNVDGFPLEIRRSSHPFTELERIIKNKKF